MFVWGGCAKGNYKTVCGKDTLRMSSFEDSVVQQSKHPARQDYLSRPIAFLATVKKRVSFGVKVFGPCAGDFVRIPKWVVIDLSAKFRTEDTAIFVGSSPTTS